MVRAAKAMGGAGKAAAPRHHRHHHHRNANPAALPAPQAPVPAYQPPAPGEKASVGLPPADALGAADGAGPIGGGQPANKADAFIAEALKFLGQPYQWGGGHGGKTGVQPVDCSGLVTQAARLAGLNFDGTAADQQAKGTPISMNDLEPGDLVFHGHPAEHVGIYIGDGKVIHAPHTGEDVQIVDLKSYGYFDNAARLFDRPGQAVGANNAAPGADAPNPAPRQADAAPPAGKPDAPRGDGGSYTVKSGDSLWKIAQEKLGDGNRWPELYALNKDVVGGNPNLIHPGQVLKLPGGAARADQGKAPNNNANAAANNAPAQAPQPTPAPAGNADVHGFEKLLAKLNGAGVTQDELAALSARYNVPLRMILAVIQQESGGDPSARSGAGAEGLMQLMPDTARGLGVNNPLDPHQNVEGGVKLLGENLQRYNGDVAKALAAYNAGPGAVAKYGGVPPYAETQAYVANITRMMA